LSICSGYCCHPSYPVCHLLISDLLFSFVLLLPPLVCCPMAVNFDATFMVAFSPLAASLHIMSFIPLAALRRQYYMLLLLICYSSWHGFSCCFPRPLSLLASLHHGFVNADSSLTAQSCFTPIAGSYELSCHFLQGCMAVLPILILPHIFLLSLAMATITVCCTALRFLLITDAASSPAFFSHVVNTVRKVNNFQPYSFCGT